MIHRIFLPLFLSCLVFSNLLSQSDEDLRSRFKYNIFSTSEKIKVDGHLDESTWLNAEIGTDFWQKIPYFEEGADPKTEIMLSYNDDFLFVAARCYQDAEITISTMRRDVYWPNDGRAIVLDPLNTKTNSTMFGTSAVGVQWDATLTPNSDISSDWSNKWYVETQKTGYGWTAEFAIPFKVLRYDQSSIEWGMNFVRNLQFCNEYHNWTAVPEGFWPPNAAFAGSLVWDKIPSKKGGNYNLIPYVSGGIRKAKDEELAIDRQTGMDAKWAMTSSLNLDLTVNPDFSQIEVDELVTNLTRFNIFLPEKRTFFLENADVFANFGTDEFRPFFSRRIGLNENLEAVPIIYGARLTGNLSSETRIGVMNVQSPGDKTNFGLNQSAISLKRQFGRSFIQGLFLNRYSFERNDDLLHSESRNLSLESFYQTEDGQWQAWLSGHGSFKPGFKTKNLVSNTGFRFRNSNWTFITDLTDFQENYFAEMGFAARINNYDAVRDTTIRVPYKSIKGYAEYQFRPRKGMFQNHRFGWDNAMFTLSDWGFNEFNSMAFYNMTLKNTMEMNISTSYSDLDLLFPFSFTDETPLPSGRYDFLSGQIRFSSDRRKDLSFDGLFRFGEFYNGTLNRYSVTANYRVQPWGNLSFTYQRNDLNFPDEYGSSQIIALLSKLEIGFTKNVLWTSLFQYVDQSDFLGINSRLQWRFSPMSDLFIVYIDNYSYETVMSMTRELQSENRALVVKLNYWY